MFISKGIIVAAVTKNTLQQDLDNLAAWEKMWGMQFHPEKCISLSVTRSQKTFHTSYILKGHTLESVIAAKYLGITISKDMNCAMGYCFVY
jgi:hypothetical protein